MVEGSRFLCLSARLLVQGLRWIWSEWSLFGVVCHDSTDPMITSPSSVTVVKVCVVCQVSAAPSASALLAVLLRKHPLPALTSLHPSCFLMMLVTVLVTHCCDKMSEKKQPTEGLILAHSLRVQWWWGSHGGGAWSWSHCTLSQDAERCLLVFSFTSIQTRTQATGWYHPH